MPILRRCLLESIGLSLALITVVASLGDQSSTTHFASVAGVAATIANSPGGFDGNPWVINQPRPSGVPTPNSPGATRPALVTNPDGPLSQAINSLIEHMNLFPMTFVRGIDYPDVNAATVTYRLPNNEFFVITKQKLPNPLNINTVASNGMNDSVRQLASSSVLVEVSHAAPTFEAVLVRPTGITWTLSITPSVVPLQSPTQGAVVSGTPVSAVDLAAILSAHFDTSQTDA